MTYPFKFATAGDPTLTFGRSRDWGPLGAREVHATPGRYPGTVSADHRVIFYLTPGVTTDCVCEGVGHRRIGAPGDFDLVPGGAAGFWEDHAACDMISVRLAPGFVADTAEALGAPADRARLAPRIGARDPLVEHVALALAAELAAPAAAGRIYADSLAVALATRLLNTTAGAGMGWRQTLSKPQLRRILDYVDANLDGELSLERLAEVAGISIPHLTTLFRRTMGQSAHAYVMERRVHRARQLLLDKRLPIAEAALEAGFAHQSHMARWMRRLLGVTPTEMLRA